MRTIIRKAVFDCLFDKTDFGKRVFRSRRVPLNDQEDENVRDGVILIYLEREQSQVINVSPVIYRRSLELSIVVLKTMLPEESELVEDQLEEVAQQIEDIFGDNDTLDGKVSRMILTGYEFKDDEDSEYKQGAVKLTYSIEYELERGMSEDELDDLGTSSVMFEHNGHKDFPLTIVHQELPSEGDEH